MVKQFYKDEYAIIELDDEVPCVKVTLQGMPKFSEHYQLVQQKRLELLHKEQHNYEVLHMLTDSRTAGPVLNEDVHYFKNEILPEMEKAGVRCLAVVLPASKYTQLTIREMTSDAKDITVELFDSLREARQWLKSKSEVYS
jgi:hypothetical protein